MNKNALNQAELNQGLIRFLQASPTPFHAVREMALTLSQVGYQRLFEQDEWALSAAGKYYVTRNDSSIIAFNLSGQDLRQSGLRMVGAHTDSPCLKIKPNPEMSIKGFRQLGVEVYGGALLNPWFDRDLSLAGRVTYADKTGAIKNALIDFKQPVATIPSLAIHLDKEANTARSINAQTDIPIVLGLWPQDEPWSFKELVLEQLTKDGLEASHVLDYEIYCYDTEAPAITGLNQEFIASARLDNLLSCYLGLQALLQAQSNEQCRPSLLVCSDHEEVGSGSAAGARGNLLQTVLERMAPESQSRHQTVANSMMVSVDNAHGIHPNYAAKYDDNHGPLFNAGPVIKVNASQRYATNSETGAVFRQLCASQEVPVQSFVVRSDMGCGSTIGPITATEIGVRTLDIGIPTFAMHSIRELAGSQDTVHLFKALSAFYQLDSIPRSSCV
ncbi:MAG: M18 family aminopeptidase [Pseudomonadales bacterium]|nr:M18 family aminopeptidase [Pseudomonadales bacterium]